MVGSHDRRSVKLQRPQNVLLRVAYPYVRNYVALKLHSTYVKNNHTM